VIFDVFMVFILHNHIIPLIYTFVHKINYLNFLLTHTINDSNL